MPRAIFNVKVTPRASRDVIAGWRDGALLVRLRAPPVDGKANEALINLLAKRLDLAPSAIEIVSGATSRTKRLRIEGMEEAELKERLEAG